MLFKSLAGLLFVCAISACTQPQQDLGFEAKIPLSGDLIYRN